MMADKANGSDIWHSCKFPIFGIAQTAEYSFVLVEVTCMLGLVVHMQILGT